MGQAHGTQLVSAHSAGLARGQEPDPFSAGMWTHMGYIGAENVDSPP